MGRVVRETAPAGPALFGRRDHARASRWLGARLPCHLRRAVPRRRGRRDERRAHRGRLLEPRQAALLGSSRPRLRRRSRRPAPNSPPLSARPNWADLPPAARLQKRRTVLAPLVDEFFEWVRAQDDLGRSASGTMDRPGFRDLVGRICEGKVGAVFCLEASRLARNGRDWHHLLELCGLVGAYVIDTDGVHDPGLPNDRLLLGLKGTMSEFEVTLIRKRLVDTAVAKARRGELRIGGPIGYVWNRDAELMMDPDRRIQDAIRTVFRLLERLGSATQVLLHKRREGLLFPRPSDAKRSTQLVWRAPSYRNVITVLQNPFYAGAYAYGKSKVQTDLVDGSLRKRYGRARPMDAWTVLTRDHHEAYVPWETFELNRDRLSRNAYGQRAGAAKSSRGGQALMAGLLRCRRCGRMLRVVYGGHYHKPRYSCSSHSADTLAVRALSRTSCRGNTAASITAAELPSNARVVAICTVPGNFQGVMAVRLLRPARCPSLALGAALRGRDDAVQGTHWGL
jgi:DNA invertase Pin-like site-specific DNA recombinase